MPEGCTKAKAKDVLRVIEEQLLKGVYLPDKKIPLFRNVAHDWLQQKKNNVRGSTLDMYDGHLNNHFDIINDMPVNRITIATVEKYISEKQVAGMNITTLRKIIITFNQVMKYAVRHRYIDYNPVADAERPRANGKIEETDLLVLNIDQINDFLNAVDNQKFKTLFTIAIMCGARQGEILGLKWSDINWENSQIHIQRTYNNRKWYLPKSKGSNRKVDIGPILVDLLKDWHKVCAENEYDLIFPNDEGLPIVHTVLLRRYFWPALKKAGLPHIRFHDLRHTYASLQIARGQNIKYIQSQLGHADPTVTLRVYAHLMNPVNQEAAVGLENMILNSGSKMVAGEE
jgi:integrase